LFIDVHAEGASNPDYTLSLERIKRWEKEHGQIPAGAVVAMRTDWSKR
jgi:kynurenine formamidase